MDAPEPKKIEVISQEPTTADGETAANLSNQDFRKLLNSRRKSTSDDHDDNDEDDEGRPSSSKQAQGRKAKTGSAKYESYKKWQARKAAQEQEAPKYRDRARERRENKDIEDYIELEKYRQMTAEESQFLGGDLQHTHLVKGLDLALLNKYKQELEEKEEKKLEEALKDSEAKTKEAKAQADEAARKEREAIKFVSTLGRNVYRLAVTTAKLEQKEKVEHFLPGRTLFEFDLDPHFSQDIPTTLIQSKNDCPAVVERASAWVSDDVSRRIHKIFDYLRQAQRQGKKGKRKDKDVEIGSNAAMQREKEAQANIKQEDTDMEEGEVPTLTTKRASTSGPMAMHMDDDDDDIFAGAGRDYVPTVGEAKSAVAKANYFGAPPSPRASSSSSSSSSTATPSSTAPSKSTSAASSDSEPSTSSSGVSLGAIASAAFAGVDRMPNQGTALVPSSAGTDKKARMLEDAYPEFGDIGYDVDSDDEDYSQMDRVGKPQAKPWDFQTEEEYSQYKLGREANPKAAYQFGVKMKDGRRDKSGLKHKGQASEDAKLNKQWQQIQQIMSKRDGGRTPAHHSSGGGDDDRVSKRARILGKR